ncbi:hypothetical protein Selin_1322 [Desulfurispirillum indicum S5]|uniref:Lipoprotein n=1 Tax=Desulfurispirillum indicum (strain ATCC BAA-1389 / DSM 22839 / S5) TaxID=653733 RepID=E6W5M6_DESIS|nr:hypothetical protein [Desulfurispirillum indicum]ADU66057.1 hypothetical protein Selin_1322 [Desulfurispirillum indicum S5]
MVPLMLRVLSTFAVTCLMFSVLLLSSCAVKIPAVLHPAVDCEYIEGAARLRIEDNTSLRMDFVVTRPDTVATVHFTGAFAQRYATLVLTGNHVSLFNHPQRSYSVASYDELCFQQDICFGGEDFIYLLAGDFSRQRQFSLDSYQCQTEHLPESEIYTCRHAMLADMNLRILSRQCVSVPPHEYTIPDHYEALPLSRQKLR